MVFGAKQSLPQWKAPKTDSLARYFWRSHLSRTGACPAFGLRGVIESHGSILEVFLPTRRCSPIPRYEARHQTSATNRKRKPRAKKILGVHFMPTRWSDGRYFKSFSPCLSIREIGVNPSILYIYIGTIKSILVIVFIDKCRDYEYDCDHGSANYTTHT